MLIIDLASICFLLKIGKDGRPNMTIAVGVGWAVAEVQAAADAFPECKEIDEQHRVQSYAKLNMESSSSPNFTELQDEFATMLLSHVRHHEVQQAKLVVLADH